MRPTNDILQLIRLHDGALPAVQGTELRDRLAIDEELRDQWRRLRAALTTPVSASNAIGFDDVERIAAAVEEDVVDQFEIDDQQVHELASLDRWLRSDATEVGEVPRAVRDRMAGVVLQHIQPGKRKPQASTLRPATPRSFTSQKRRGRRGVRGTSWVVASVGLLAALVVWIGMLFRPPTDPSLSDVAENPGDPVLPAPRTVETPVTRDDAEGLPEPMPDAVDSPAPLVQQQPVRPSDETPDEPLNELTIVARHEPLEWQQVVGLIVVADTEQKTWRGVLSSSQDAASGQEPLVAYRSLPESWGRAVTASGVEFTLGEETVASLSVSVTEHQTIIANIEHGRMAIGGLGRDSAIQLELPILHVEIQAMSDATSIAVVSNEGSPELFVLSGEIAIGELVNAAPTAIQWDGDGWANMTSSVRPIAWIDPPARIPMEQEWLSGCLTEPDVTAALLRSDGGATARVMTAAAEWSFALDPVRAMPIAAASTQPVHREAAISWLSSTRNDADQQALVWNALVPTLPDSEMDVAHWFAVARGEAEATPDVLQELALGVGRTQPVFVRHAAIHFLRQATGERFAAYDPDAPTPEAVAEVRAFVRQFTQPPSRPSRGGGR